jgi:hypothetical protein
MFGITTFAQSPFAALGGNAYNQSVSESVATADDFIGVIAYASDIAESMAVADAQAVIQGFAVAINESTGPVDTPSTTLLAESFVEDSIAQTDVYEQLSGKFVNMDDSITVADAYTLSNSIFNAVVAEIQNPDDTVSSTGLILFEEQDETMGVADTQAAIRVVSAAVAESIANLDAYTETRALAAVIAEDTHADDIVGVAYTGNVAISELTAPVDAVGGQRQFDYFISESVAPADAQAGVFNYVVAVAETMAAADNTTFTVNTRALPTGILITISLSNVNVWGDIDDDADPNWVQIND